MNKNCWEKGDKKEPPNKPQIEVPFSGSNLRYEGAKARYLISGLSQDVQLLLNRIISSPNIPARTKHQPLQQMVTEVVVSLQMNELEIALWSLILENFVWLSIEDYFQDQLLYSGYASKREFNNDLSCIDHYLGQTFVGFAEAFEGWSAGKTFNFSPRQVNQKFNELSTPPSINCPQKGDYNYYVDEIILNCPPSFINDNQQARNKVSVKAGDSEIPSEYSQESDFSCREMDEDMIQFSND